MNSPRLIISPGGYFTKKQQLCGCYSTSLAACAYDPRDRLKQPAFIYLFVTCPPSHPVFHPEFLLSELLLLQFSELLLKSE